VCFYFKQPKDTSRYDETMYVRLLLPELCKVNNTVLSDCVSYISWITDQSEQNDWMSLTFVFSIEYILVMSLCTDVNLLVNYVYGKKSTKNIFFSNSKASLLLASRIVTCNTVCNLSVSG